MNLDTYLARIDRVSTDERIRSCAKLTDGSVVDPNADVLVWASNGRHPMADMLATWLDEGVITRAQADATEAARDADTAAFLADYRANPPQPTAEQRAEMRAAFGPGATVVDVITGRPVTL